MKQTLTLLCLSIFFVQTSFAQFTTSGNCTAFMIVGTTFTDSGGAGGDYSNNELASCTFCPDNPGEFVVIDFTTVDLETCCDILSATENTGCLLGGITAPTTITATTGSDGCLTVDWNSDGSVTNPGWEATVSTTATGADPSAFFCPEPAPACGVNPIPGNTCDIATDLDLSGPFCGTTDNTYTPDSPGTLAAEFCGALDNNSFLVFDVAADPVVIDFWITGPAGCTDGPQFQFFTAPDPCDAVAGVWTTIPMDYTILQDDGMTIEMADEATCVSGVAYGAGTQGQITLDGVTPGQTIYLMVDGYAGDVCDYVFEGESGVVPAELTAFEGAINGEVNTISWTTASELNTAWHIVERSINGKDGWQEIGRQAAAGNTVEQIAYSIDDVKPLSVAYYRLRTLDLDGTESFSPVITITRETKYLEVLSVSPMPTSDIVAVSYRSANASTVTMKLVDMLGNVIGEETIELSANTQTISLDLSKEEVGMYLLILDNGIRQVVERLIKQ